MMCLMVPYFTSYLYWDWHYFLVPFTNWTLIITTASIAHSICASNHRHSLKLNFLANNHILYTMAITMNFVVMSVYWSFLHKEQVKIHYNDPGVGHGRVVHLCLVHSIPGICCTINSYLTCCRLKRSFWKLISFVCMIYGVFVYLFWKITGRIQYPFLNFQENQMIAFRNILFINFFATCSYLIIYEIDTWIKNGRKDDLKMKNLKQKQAEIIQMR